MYKYTWLGTRCVPQKARLLANYHALVPLTEATSQVGDGISSFWVRQKAEDFLVAIVGHIRKCIQGEYLWQSLIHGCTNPAVKPNRLKDDEKHWDETYLQDGSCNVITGQMSKELPNEWKHILKTAKKECGTLLFWFIYFCASDTFSTTSHNTYGRPANVSKCFINTLSSQMSRTGHARQYFSCKCTENWWALCVGQLARVGDGNKKGMIEIE